jgi:hypothetical protein
MPHYELPAVADVGIMFPNMPQSCLSQASSSEGFHSAELQMTIETFGKLVGLIHCIPVYKRYSSVGPSTSNSGRCSHECRMSLTVLPSLHAPPKALAGQASMHRRHHRAEPADHLDLCSSRANFTLASLLSGLFGASG